MKKAIATIDADIGTMTIFYHGAGHPLTAETDSVCEEMEYTPNSIDDAVDAVSAMYSNGDWNLEWVEMAYDLNAIYAAAKSEAKHRDEVYARFLRGNHPDAERVFNFHNHIVTDLVLDYKRHGGKRDLSHLVAEDKGDA